MPKTIQQSVTLPAPASDLYRMYLDPRRHAGQDLRAARHGIPGVQRRALGAHALHAARADDRPDLALDGIRGEGHRLHLDPYVLAPGQVGAHPAGARERCRSRRSGGDRRLEKILLEALARAPHEEAPGAVRQEDATTRRRVRGARVGIDELSGKSTIGRPE
jgi:hypothetical protein